MSQKLKSKIFVLLGTFGAIIVLFGFTQSPAQIFYVSGASMLLITAIYFNLIYFIALQLILISGHSAIFLGIGPVLQMLLPIFLCLQLLIFYWINGQLKNFYLWTGIIGIALLSIGFSYENMWVFFLGSSAVSIYSFYAAYYKNKVSLIWAISNLAFSIATGSRLII